MARAGEIRSLTGLRGVAACFVVVFHLAHGSIQTDAINRIVSHGYLAVDLFLILSGFVLAITYSGKFARGEISYPGFLVHRLIRIWPVYVVLTFVYAAIMLAKGVHPSGQFFYELFANVLMIQAWGLTTSIIGPGWSISAEWAACLLFPLLVALTIKPGGGGYTSDGAGGVCRLGRDGGPALAMGRHRPQNRRA